MEIGRSFSFVQEDEEWVSKILIGGLVSIIPIVGSLASLGYMAQVARNVALGEERPLPAWRDFGSLLMRGLHYLVIVLVYMLPYFVLSMLFACISGGIGATISASESEGAGGAAIGLVTCIVVPLMLIVALGGGVLSYVGLARYIAADRLAAAFEFGEVIALLRGNLGLWIMALVVGILSGLVAMLGLIGCFVGVIFTLFFAYCVQGHALGQIIREVGLLGGPGAAPSQSAPPTIQI